MKTLSKIAIISLFTLSMTGCIYIDETGIDRDVLPLPFPFNFFLVIPAGE